MNIAWEKVFGGGSSDTFHDLIEGSNGYLVAVGETNSSSIGGTDGLVVIHDFLGQQIVAPKNFGGKKDDVFKGVVQTLNGEFWLAGHTKSKGLGKNDGWLVRLNETGGLLEERTFGTAEEDKFQAIVALKDGSVVLVGEKNDGKDGDIWLIKIDNQKTVWEKNIGKKNYLNIAGAAPTTDGGLVIAGDSESSKGNIFLLKIDRNGNEKWSKTYGEKGWEEAKNVAPTSDNGFAIAGMTRAKGSGGMDCWLVKIDEDGFKQWDRAFGGRDDDFALDVVETNKKDFFLFGKTKSHTPGARAHNLYLVQVDASGMMRRELNEWGGKKEEKGKAILQLHDGSLAMAAETDSKGKGSNDAWLLKLAASNPRGTSGARAGATIATSDITLHTHDGKLKAKDKTFLSFQLENKAAMNLENVQVRVSSNSGAQGVKIWERNYVGFVAKNETKTVNIPVEAVDGLQTGNNDFNVSVTSGDQKLDEFSMVVESKMAKAATLDIAEYAFTNFNLANENITIEVKNGGDFPSAPVIVTFQCPTGIQALSSVKVALGKVPAGGSKKADFNFKVTDSFRGTTPSVTYVILEGGAEKIRNSVTPKGNNNLAGGTIIRWIGQYDQDDIDVTNLRVDEPFIDAKVKVISSSPLGTENFRLVKNEVALDGSKMDTDVLSPPKKEDGMVSQNFSQKIPLEEGENRIVMEVVTPYGTSESKMMIVTYDPRRPNLHIVSIGPKHSDLQFTQKDATDFAKAFSQQSGKLFDKVYIETLDTPQKTSLNGIKKAIKGLQNRYKRPDADQKINDRDVLMVFLSSHGSVIGETESDKRFRIRPSDYDMEYPEISSLDYRDDVIGLLADINCKKLIFIDACHSGSARDPLAEALVAVNQTASGLSTLSSCQAGELSYEDSNWGNGAFTKSILDALSNQSFEDQNGAYRANADGNDYLTLGELYKFLRRRVPNLVKGKADATTTQVPFMPEKQLDEGLPIFWYE